MKLWKALEKALKELKVEFKGVRRKYKITIEDDPFIHIVKLEDESYHKDSFLIDVRDWEKVRNSIDSLVNKELE